jgi:hypothetical protein
MRKHLAAWPWQLWWIIEPATRIMCALVGHAPITDWSRRAAHHWICTWCMEDVPAPTEKEHTR